MTSPADPDNDSSGWILISNISRIKVTTVDYFPPIVAQHVAVIRFDRLELALLEVEVYGKSYSVKRIKISTIYYN